MDQPRLGLLWPVVAVIALAGLIGAASGSIRGGGWVLVVAFAIAGVVRLVAPSALAGALVSRGRAFDVTWYAVATIALAVVFAEVKV